MTSGDGQGNGQGGGEPGAGDDGGRDSATQDMPRIGRGRRRFRVPAQQVMAILMTLVALVAILTLRKPCAQGVGRFFKAFEPPPDGGPRVPRPDLPP